MSILSLWARGALAASLLVACGGFEEPTAQDACQEAGYSVANRTVTCGQSRDVGNARYQQLLDEHPCVGAIPGFRDITEDPVAPGPNTLSGNEMFECAIKIRELPCEQVATNGDSSTWWLQASPSCAKLFGGVGGQGGSGG